ncbi:Uncharacterized protein ABC855_g4915 [[Candida] zeylanoides]
MDFADPILTLARDPNLNREKAKTSQLVHIIHNFPPTERRISKLCQLSLALLQSLEKIELQLKNWQFLSLDINADSHFNTDTDDIRRFNNDIASNVLTQCQDFQHRLHHISQDLDHITRSTRSLTPMEFVSDSGTLLTQLTLRNIRLKDDTADRITVAYSRAKLINIGTDLESMLSEDQTVATYKSFVVSLLRQLNAALEQEDSAAKYECLAVISDMEKMFEAFKMERLSEAAELAESEREALRHEISSRGTLALPEDEDDAYVYVDTPATEVGGVSPKRHLVDEDYDSDMGSSMYSSSYQPPMVHSITRSAASGVGAVRRDSLTSMSASLHKTTLSEEMPYLMSAFDSAKTIGEDVSHYMPRQPSPAEAHAAAPVEAAPAPFKPALPHAFGANPLYSESAVLKPPMGSASSYLYANHSLLAKLGIKPQVITTDVPRAMAANTSANTRAMSHSFHGGTLAGKENKHEERAKMSSSMPALPTLTSANLASLTNHEVD